MVFQKDLTPLTKKGTVKKHRGKGSSEYRLPSRHAMQALTREPPEMAKNSMNDYSKATPDFTSAPTALEDFTDTEG